MGKRNFEWPNASIWDGYFTQDKEGGITERVNADMVMSRLRSEGFLTQLANHVAMDTSPEAVPSQVGVMAWNEDAGTMDIQQPGGVTLQVGQETQILVTNRTGSAIENGRVVYLTGAQGNRPTVALAEADSLDPSFAIAVATQALPNNGEGFATALGLVRDLNTAAFAEGAVLYLSDTAGAFTDTPSSVRSIRVGYVVRSHATTGSIFVAIQRVENLDDLGNVTVPTPSAGSGLVWDTSLSKWRERKVTVSTADPSGIPADGDMWFKVSV